MTDTQPVFEAHPPALAITLFGPMRVLVDGCPLPPLRSRKALWLLALLALRHKRPVERAWLAGTLWPDADQDQAFASLRVVLSELRKALGTQAERVQSPGRALLCLEGADVDVAAFDAAAASKNPATLARAVAFYAGPLLEGCSEEWAGQEREARKQDCLRALTALADAALAAGDAAGAAGYYRQAASLDPWRDAAQRGLMEALARSGDTNAALHVYREFAAVLRGSDPRSVPDKQTAALYGRLRAQAREQVKARAADPDDVREQGTSTVTGSLPYPMTELVGREDERNDVIERLRRSRLVTLTGPGGIGKTRLAVAVASQAVAEYPDGACLVALESLSERAKVAPHLAEALGLREVAGRSPLASLTEHLRAKRLLLVIDNCEHVLTEIARIVYALLQDCAELRVLATSREALGITGEAAWTVPPLSVPDPEHLPVQSATRLRVLMGYESILLFTERAQAAQKTFQLTSANARDIALICARLAGMPLAIELAAARVRAMTIEQMALRLDDYLGLLAKPGRGMLSRQGTMRATLDWSYALLSVPEQLLLARVSVFDGGWTLEAAEAICSGQGIDERQVLDLLTSLVDKSLLMFEERKPLAEGRFLLLEMVQQYASECLEARGAAERIRVQTRHQAWFLEFAETAAAGMSGPAQGEWLQRLETDYGNLRTLLEAYGEGAGEAEGIKLRLAIALWLFWDTSGRYSEGRGWLQKVLADTGADSAERGKGLFGAGMLAYRQGEYGPADDLLHEALGIFRRRSDISGIASVLNGLGNIAYRRSDYMAARALFEESLALAREASDVQQIAHVLANLGNVAFGQNDYVTARKMHEESLSIHLQTGGEHRIALARGILGRITQDQGDLASARVQHQESLNIFRRLGDRGSAAWSLTNLGHIAFDEEDMVSAQALYAESMAIRRELGDREGIATCLIGLGWVASRQADPVSAHALYGEALEIHEELKDTEGVAECLNGLAGVFLSRAQPREAATLFGASHHLLEEIGCLPFSDKQNKGISQQAQARTQLGECAFAAAWEAGCAFSSEQAIAYARAACS